MLPRPTGLFGASRMDAVNAERAEMAASLRHRMGVMRKAAEAAAGKAKIPDGGGAALAPDVRARMEPRLGADLSAVKVHAAGDSAQAAKQLGARAFTVGNDVHFGAGELAPGSKEGDRLLAHELTHVVQGQRSGVQRKPDGGGDAHADAAHEGPAGSDHDVSQPGDPAEKEADAVADKVTDQLHAGGQDKAGHEAHGQAAAGAARSGAAPAGHEKAPAIGAKLVASARIFRKPGDPKSVAELVTKLTGKALEAHNQMVELDQQRAIDGICSGAKVKQADGTFNLPAAQSAFEARWLDATVFAAKKKLKDQAYAKKLEDALATIQNGCDETDGTNRPGASLGDGSSESALVWETENGKPWKSKEGHYQKVPNYADSIHAAVTLLAGEQSKIHDAALLERITKAIDRGSKRVAKMQPSIAGWKGRVGAHPTIWKADGDSKVQPGFPTIK